MNRALRAGSDDDSLGTPGQQALRTLSRIGDADLEEMVTLVQSVCGVKSAAISVLVEDEYHLLVTAGMEPLTCDAGDSLCTHTRHVHETVIVEDARLDDRFNRSPYVDGRLRAVRFYASAPIYAPDGSMVGRLCLFDREPKTLTPLQERTLTTLAHNITKVLELRTIQNSDVQPSTTQLTSSDDALRLAAQISHDLRIPLTALSTSLDMLHESPPSDLDPARLRVFETARRSARRMGRMLDSLLDLDQAGSLRDVTDVDLTSLAQQVVSDVDGLLAQAGATVRIGTLPVVRADADQLYSVFLNLVSNAVKFRRPGVVPEVRIDGRRTDTGWRVSVVDNGCGIPADKRDDVFAMFTRINTSVEGSGIGLATVQRVVESHGGRVGVDEPDGSGAVVWFELPDAPARPTSGGSVVRSR